MRQTCGIDITRQCKIDDAKFKKYISMYILKKSATIFKQNDIINF